MRTSVEHVYPGLNHDFIGIRHKMFISHSYDHRVVNGALGGMFIKVIKDSLEAFNVNTEL